jgi:hypothetical protein
MRTSFHFKRLLVITLLVSILFALICASLGLFRGSRRPPIEVLEQYCVNQTSAVMVIGLDRAVAYGNCIALPQSHILRQVAQDIDGPFDDLSKTYGVYCGNIWSIRYSAGVSHFNASLSLVWSSPDGVLLRFEDRTCTRAGRPQNCTYQFLYSYSFDYHTRPVTVSCP